MDTNARALYSSAIVVDAAAPISPYAAIDTGASSDSIVRPYEEAGVTFSIFTVVDDFPNSIEQTFKLLCINRRYFLSQPEKYVLANRPEDVRQAKLKGRLAVSFAFQGSNALLGDLSLVESYRRLGVIQMLLAYNVANMAADGCHEERNAGLSQFGRQLIAEMNRLGMIVDVSHVGIRSSLEALEVTSKPPVFSHSTPQKFSTHARNISDQQIRACASKDGLVGLTGVSLFMDPADRSKIVSRLTDTIEYVVQLVGARHAGVGLDYVSHPGPLMRHLRANAGLYGGGKQYSTDEQIYFSAPSVLPQVAEELLRRRYSEIDVKGILGENYLRVWAANNVSTSD